MARRSALELRSGILEIAESLLENLNLGPIPVASSSAFVHPGEQSLGDLSQLTTHAMIAPQLTKGRTSVDASV
jgi:hypothetical protein